jgi:hypothetical protein
VDPDLVVLLVWTATAARMCAEECRFEAGAARAEYYRQARRAAREAIKVARSFRCYMPHALREAALLAQARGHTHRARLLFEDSLMEAEFFPLETERTRRAMRDQPAAQVYDLAPSPTLAPTETLAAVQDACRHGALVVAGVPADNSVAALRNLFELAGGAALPELELILGQRLPAV